MRPLVVFWWLAVAGGQIQADDRPNFIIIFCDDLGYGDLGCFGHPTIRTPRLDALAAEGQKWTQFYAADNVCTPSRAGLLTGRYPIRSGMTSDARRVLFPDSAGGLPAKEVTLASLLRGAGYDTAAIGKWHLGHVPGHLPTDHGFQSYWGIPYSNDMNLRVRSVDQRRLAEEERFEAYDVPILEGTKEVERPADQRTITRRATDRAVTFIRSRTGQFDPERPSGIIEDPRPYFLYFAPSMPHVPLFRSAPFKGRSAAGIYGDVVEELDDAVGRIVDAVRAGVGRQTFLVFTSDNGPWQLFGTHGGSSGSLRDAKGSTWEGGVRVPMIAWAWPEGLRLGTVMEMGSALDLLPTYCSLAGVKPPSDRVLDGHDLTPVFRGTGPSPRREVFYYHGPHLFAVRQGDHKLHFQTKTSYIGEDEAETHEPPLLFHLGVDPGERFPIEEEPGSEEVIRSLRTLADRHRGTVEPAEDQLAKRLPQLEEGGPAERAAVGPVESVRSTSR